MGYPSCKTSEQMETPSVVFYEHNFDDSIIKSLSKNVLNLGNECRALAQENARLKDELERLNNLIISGGAVNPDASIYIE
jgi:hypothetical protein